MEPRFSLPTSTPLSSKTGLVIGGVKIYVYGLRELKQQEDVELVVLYLAHMRTRTYLVTEAIAHEILHRYKSDGRKKRYEMIAVTMDMRNHGEREVSAQANLTWRDGNEDHAMDMLSIISGSTQDFKLILDYLPAYLPQFTVFHNVMMGISLGGHSAYRIASLAPGQFEAYISVVGCPTLTPLLLSRLGINCEALDTSLEATEGIPYVMLEKTMSQEQKRRWPRALADKILDDDRRVLEEFPTDVPVMLCNGRCDTLVPAHYTAAWLERRRMAVPLPPRPADDNVTFFVQDNTGHSCTKEMVAMIADWLGNMYEFRALPEFVSLPVESRL